MSADTSAVKRKTRKKSNYTGTEKKTGNTVTLKKGEGKGIGHQRDVCLGIKDRR